MNLYPLSVLNVHHGTCLNMYQRKRTNMHKEMQVSLRGRELEYTLRCPSAHPQAAYVRLTRNIAYNGNRR
jgi:hypothetical protein